ncbi:MAG: hypothetical protein GF375_05550, partial [Candidatus Omnitrophica bacterium]|nr:hypothetical protein [Candidatus Omnitrophota bacterium]MBD3269453.1 hypothetical protein [Candidatus Omnitrophota bacterium]
SEEKAPLCLEAKVVWLADKMIQSGYFPGMGLEFLKIDAEAQKKIIQFVEKHLAGSL